MTIKEKIKREVDDYIQTLPSLLTISAFVALFWYAWIDSSFTDSIIIGLLVFIGFTLLTIVGTLASLLPSNSKDDH